jgi:16S rRNA (guanine527-N7)-methyltransferase
MTIEKKKNLLTAEAEKCQISLSDLQASQFLDYYDLLVETNKVMNLTTITDFPDVVRKHFMDSLSVQNVINVNKADSLIDVGTGAGFPGVPIKIMYPHLKVTLVDSLGKRVRFLEQVVEKLNLENVNCIHSRAEDLARNRAYREKYDLCVSRAVANLAVLAEYDLPFVKKGGYFVSYKSADSEEEIEKAKRAIHILGGKIEKVDTFELYDMGRSIVKIKKIKQTPGVYPRKAGTPSKKPLY